MRAVAVGEGAGQEVWASGQEHRVEEKVMALDGQVAAAQQSHLRPHQS